MPDKPFVAEMCARCPKCGIEVAKAESPVIDAEDKDEAKRTLVDSLKQMQRDGDITWDLVQGVKIHLVNIKEVPEEAMSGEDMIDDGSSDDIGGIEMPPESGEAIPPPQRSHSRSDD